MGPLKEMLAETSMNEQLLPAMTEELAGLSYICSCQSQINEGNHFSLCYGDGLIVASASNAIASDAKKKDFLRRDFPKSHPLICRTLQQEVALHYHGQRKRWV